MRKLWVVFCVIFISFSVLPDNLMPINSSINKVSKEQNRQLNGLLDYYYLDLKNI